MDKFNKEYISGSLDREKPENNLHNDKRLIKDCDDRNNSRNRDVLTRAKASNNVSDLDTLIEEPSKEDYEEELIREIDKKDARAAIEWFAEQLNKDEEKLEEKLISEEKE